MEILTALRLSGKPSNGLAVIGLLGTVGMIATPAETAQAQSIEALQRLSIEDLANIEISSLSKKTEPLSDAAAAVYVITHDDVVRSGATSIPEMLRLAPNLQVAQVNASTWRVSARGFSTTAVDKLLVLIDGRSVYTPFYSGVFWDMQEVLPENIERIEVISGPGATLWGANAVNGVINIITRKSGDTPGGVLDIGAGNRERHASLQYGGKLGEDLSYRLYATGFDISNNVTATGANARDGWNKSQGGFRADWTPAGDLVTVQGDFYRGSESQFTTPNVEVSGRNLLARWNHQMDGESSIQIQAYYDYVGRTSSTRFSDFIDTYDLDVQHSFSWGGWQQIVWGGGYRVVSDDFPTVLSATQSVFFVPQSRTLGLANIFVQDSISLTDALKLVLGTKLEDDPYTGLEPLPSARLSWKVTDSDLLWSAVSRAVRAPSRLDRDLFQKSPTPIAGGNFQAEKVIAYEIGYRTQFSSNASISISSYYNIDQDFRTAELSPGHRLPIIFDNDMEGDSYGVELWGNYRVNDWWRLTAGFDWLHKNLHFKVGSARIGGVQIAGDDPTYQFSVRSAMNFTSDVALDLDLRDVGALPNPAVPSYVELDGRIGWTATSALEISLTAANLLHPHHLEVSPTPAVLQVGPTGVEMGRSFVVDARWKF